MATLFSRNMVTSAPKNQDGATKLEASKWESTIWIIDTFFYYLHQFVGDFL